MIKAHETLEDLNLKGYKIIQPETGFKFGIDAVLLANFTSPKSGDCGVDLGSGTGIISTIIAAKSNISKIIGIEIQEHVWDSAVRTTMYNKLEDRLEFINEDIKNIEEILPKSAYDFVVSNPPYYKTNTWFSSNQQKNVSRHEFLVNHVDIFKAASYLLKPQKPFYMIHKPERLVELIEESRKHKLEPKEIQFVHPNFKKAPNLMLLKFVKNGKSGLKFCPPLYVYDLNGMYTDQINEIYGREHLGE